MSDERWRRVEDLFHEAADLPAAERSAFLSRETTGDDELRRDVESLLAHDAANEAVLGDAVGRALEKLPDASGSGEEFIGKQIRCLVETEITESLPPDLKPGTCPDCGRYQPLGVLGEGGMGIVYLAEQREPIRRRVALKVLKYGDAGSSVATRFESESQALALMDHPSIAQVYDAGVTADGRPYFAMEYVPGIPITDYCDRHLLRIRERLMLFQQACQAVQHAHQKGVIHRDLKPSNVLVMLQDNKPVPKIIDFGVAKAVNQRLVERTLFTEIGMLIGTPEYMSPEQADHTALDVDSTTDIYSLGVLLYELLVGALPFDSKTLRKVGYPEIHHIIREQEPAKPTARLRGMGQLAGEVARRRSSDVRSLVRGLRNDLEWITMKALEKDRTRRYATASEFAADIGRFIANEPVVAGPPGILYQSQKFVRRHVGVVAAGAAIGLALLIGAFVSFSLYMRAVREQQAAQLASYTANLAAAELQLRAGLVSDARASLGNTAPELRGWEWRHLMSRTDESQATIYTSEFVDSSDFHATYPEMRFSEDGMQLFYHGTLLHSWDTRTKRLLTDFSDVGRVLAIGQHGRIVLVGPHLSLNSDPPAEGFVLRLYDVATHRVLSELRGMTGDPGAAAISEDGTLVAAAEDIGNFFGGWEKHPAPIFIWNTRTAAVVARLDYHPGWVITLRFSPDGHHLASTFSGDKIVHLWDVKSRRQAAELKHDVRVDLTSFSRDTGMLASGSFREGTVHIWDPATGRLVRSWKANPTGGTGALAFSPNGSLLATVALGAETLSVWDTDTGRPHAVFNKTGYVEAVAFHPSAQRVYSEGFGIIKEFDLARREVLDDATAPTWSVATSPDGKYIATGSDDGVLRIYDAASGALLRSLTAHASAIRAVKFSADSGLVASGSLDKLVKLWSVADGRLVRTLTGHTDAVTSVSFYPNGQRIVSGARDQTVRIWNIANTVSPAVISTMSRVCSVEVSPDGQTIAAFLLASGISIWNAETGQYAGILDTGYRFGDRTTICKLPALSQDGQLLVVPDPSHRSIVVWNYPRRKVVRTVPVFRSTEYISSLALSPDSTRIAIGGEGGGTLSVWDLKRETLLVNLSGHSGGVSSVTWTPDGTRLVSGSMDRTVRVWDSRSPYDYDAELVVDKHSERPQLAEEVIQAIENDRTISRDLRRRAEAIAAKRGDSPSSSLWEDAEHIADEPDRSPAEYAQALRRMMLVTKRVPWTGVNHEVLGLLQYRCGEYGKTLMSEQRAMDVQKAQSHDAHAIRAMAYYRLHEIAKAQAEFSLARSIAQSDPNNEFATPALLKEAESLLYGKK